MKPVELPLQILDLGLVLEIDALDDEPSDLGSFEDDAHDQVIDILILYQFPTLLCCQNFEGVYCSYNDHKELNEDTNLVNDGWQIIQG
jgi:hypothetical protein